MNKFIVTLIIGIIIRLFLSFTTFHYDLQHFALSGWMVSQGHIIDFYDSVSKLPSDNPLVKTNPEFPFNYPPLIYLYHGLFNFLFLPFKNPDVYFQFIVAPINSLGKVEVNLYLLLTKFPYLIFDLLGLFLITKLVTNKNKYIVWCLYLFNPINLYATYMIGQFDIIPTTFTILSLYFFSRNKYNLSAISLGLGALFKIYPLFFVIPLACTQKTFLQKVKLAFLGALPYLIGSLIYLPSHGYRVSALIANQSLKSLYATIPISGGESIIIFPVILIFFYLLFYYSRSIKDLTFLIKSYFIVLTLFFIFTHTHPQWLLWLTPFLILDLAKNNFKNILLTIGLLLSWLGLVFFFDPSLSMRLFAPLNPSWSNLPDLWTILHLSPDYNFSRSLLQTVFVGFASFYIYLNLKDTAENE